MKFKLDENLPVEASILLRDIGHDAHSVQDEHLGGLRIVKSLKFAEMNNEFL